MKMRTAKNVDQKVVSITWDTVAKDAALAVTAEGVANKRWVTLTDKYWVLGVRPEHFEEKLDSAGKKQRSDIYKKIESQVVKAYTPRVQGLLKVSGASLSGLSESERAERRYWNQRTPVMMGRILSYLKRHEENADRGPVKKGVDAVMLKVVLYWIKRLKDNEEKITAFDVPAVLELLDAIKKELT
jgi:hypothetical protein